MRSVILRCPALGRDISSLLTAVPGAIVHESKHTPGTYEGSTGGHKAIVAEAKALGVDSVFVMEDDCQFTSRFRYEDWLNDVEWARVHDYDVLVGGSTRTYGERVVRIPHTVCSQCKNPERDRDQEHPGVCVCGGYLNDVPMGRLIEVDAFHSSHCIVYLASCYDKMLLGTDPIDLSMGRDCGARCLVTHPFVAVQRPSFSGCEGHDVNYVPLYQQHEAALGALR